MTDPRRPTGTDDERSDLLVEQRVRSWLASEADRPPETLATSTVARARQASQRPSWFARLRRGQDGRPRNVAQLGAVTASIAAGVFLVAVAWQGIIGPVGPDASPSPTITTTASAPANTSPSGSGVIAPAFDGRAEIVLGLDRRATALGSGFDSLWLGDEAGRLLRIDPSDATIISTTELGGVPCGPILVAASSLWLATCGSGVTTDGATLRVDPATGLVLNLYEEAGGDGVGAAAMDGLVWFVSDVQQGRLTGVDSVTGTSVGALTVGMPIRHLTAGFGSLWVSPIGRSAVLRLNPTTGEQQAEVVLSGEAGYLVTSVDAIWVAEPHQWLVGRIDPVADRLSAEIGASPGVAHLEIDAAGLLWALADDQAMRIDPTTNRIVDRFPVPVHVAFDAITTHVIATIGDGVWFADGLDLLRIDAQP